MMLKIQQAKLGIPHSMDHGWHFQLFLFEAIPFDFVFFLDGYWQIIHNHAAKQLKYVIY